MQIKARYEILLRVSLLRRLHTTQYRKTGERNERAARQILSFYRADNQEQMYATKVVCKQFTLCILLHMCVTE
jgi:hypothetical protein